MPPHGYAAHPQDERSHHTVTRTHERFDLWRIIIIITYPKQASKQASKVHILYEGIYPEYLNKYYEGRRYEGTFVPNINRLLIVCTLSIINILLYDTRYHTVNISYD